MIPESQSENNKKDWVFVLLAVIIIVGILIIWAQPVLALDQANTTTELNREDLFTFTMNNVGGSQENVTHHFTVYSSRLMQENESYHYWSVLEGQMLNQTPDKGKKWLFVWVEDYIEGATTWPYEINRFSAWVWGNTTIPAEPVQMEDFTRRADKHLKPAAIEGVSYGHPVPRDYSWFGDPYGWKDGFYQPRIEPGKSNAWSGWIKFQVPEKASLEDIQIAGWFLNYGTAYWNLVPRSIGQVQEIPTVTAKVTPQITGQAIDRIGERPGSEIIEGRKRA